jgi:hypothetical protein
MPALANPRHEKFVRNYVKTFNAGLSYRLAGFQSIAENAAYANASRLIRHDKVKRRLDELRRYVGRKSEASALSLALELDESRKLALELGQCAAAIQATMGKAKLLGLLVERREVGGAGAFDKAETLRLIEARHGSEAAEMLRRALGESTGQVPKSDEPAG